MKSLVVFALSFVFAFSSFAVSVHGPDKNAYQQKSFILQAESISAASATTNKVTGGSVKLFDLPEGFILVHGVVVDLLPTSTNLASSANTVTWGIGTTQNATGNGAIAAGETNLAYIVQTDGYTSGVTRVQGQILGGSAIRLDGSGTAADLYLNVYTTNAAPADTASVSVDGTVTITYSVLGDD